MSKRAAIIGCGYVGGALGERLVQAGHDVLATTTTLSRVAELEAKGTRGVLAEVGAVPLLRELLADRETVYLTVAPGPERPVGNRSPTRRYELYPTAVRNLLAAVQGGTVKHIVYTSSTRVYGQDDGSWVDESSPTKPTDENGRLLLDAERELLAGAESRSAGTGDRPLVATLLRLSGIYGPGRDPAHRIATLAGTQRDDGDAYVNLVHRDDIVCAMIALLEKPFHGVLNLSDDAPLTRREYYDRVLREANLSPIRWLSRSDDSGQSTAGKGKRVSNALIKRTLNLTLRYPTH